MTTVQFILGPKDGEVWNVEYLSCEIVFPVLPDPPKYAIGPDDVERLVYNKAVYRRVGDTANYVYVSGPNL